MPAIHPGEILFEEFMKPLGLSINRVARDLRVPIMRIADIVHGQRGVSSDTALPVLHDLPKLLCQKSNFFQAVSQVNSCSSNSLPAAPKL